MKKYLLKCSKVLYFLFIVCQFSCGQENKAYYVSPCNENLKYTGRINFENPNSPEIYWPGTSIKTEFEGTGLIIGLNDSTGKNFYNVIIDDSLFIIDCDPGKKWYPVISSLENKRHQLEIFRRTELGNQKTRFLGLKIMNGEKMYPVKENPKNRIIEFYGNSITAGYGNEDTLKDRPDSIFTNNYMSYAAITARHFDADYYCIARGGIGIMISWYPMIMPEMYDRLNPLDADSKYDFTEINPGIVVVNLFQNDSWLVNMPQRDEFINRFGNHPPSGKEIVGAYKEFIQSIRKVRPGSEIICTLGSMDATKEGAPWPVYIQKAVNQMRNNDDEKLHTLFFPYKKTMGHPEVEEHKKMANQLIQYIENNIDW